MKKLLIIAAVGFAALACNKGAVTPDGTGREIAILASIGPLSKVTTTGNTANFNPGDKLSLFAWTSSATAVGTPLVVDGVKNTLGTDGKWTPETQMLWADMVTPHYFLGIYPARTVTNFTADAYELKPAEYEESDLLVAKNVAGLKAQNDPVALTFNHMMAKLNVNLTFRNQWATEPTVTSVTATAKKTATVDYLSQTVTATGTATAVALTASANNAWSGLQVPQKGVQTITVTIEGKNYKYTHNTDIPLGSGKFTTVNLIVGRDQIVLASEISISPWTSQGAALEGDALEQDPYNGHAYVDMGNGLKWATCNVGADNPWDSGNYFAWGETTTKDTYNWSTYIWGDGTTFTKYTVDGTTVLEAADDAARANWGGNWRTPTDAEWTWLRDENNCTWEWTGDYLGDGSNKAGRIVTSNVNGNTIFLPAAGFRGDASLGGGGSYGYYWSSSLFENDSDSARSVDLYSGGVYRFYDSRYYGQSVRPVID